MREFGISSFIGNLDTKAPRSETEFQQSQGCRCGQIWWRDLKQTIACLKPPVWMTQINSAKKTETEFLHNVMEKP